MLRKGYPRASSDRCAFLAGRPEIVEQRQNSFAILLRSGFANARNSSKGLSGCWRRFGNLGQLRVVEQGIYRHAFFERSLFAPVFQPGEYSLTLFIKLFVVLFGDA
jgi:hypothetical protein